MSLAEWSADDFSRAQKQIRILSGLYGVLRPLDLMQPYRGEVKCAPSGVRRDLIMTGTVTPRGGSTWCFRYSAYSDIAVLPDGRIAVLFERENSRAIDIAILPALE